MEDEGEKKERKKDRKSGERRNKEHKSSVRKSSRKKDGDSSSRRVSGKQNTPSILEHILFATIYEILTCVSHRGNWR